jgi:hypothetical protein
MSMAWETSPDDVSNVLDAHGIEYDDARLEEICDLLDYDAIEQGVLHYCSMDAQTNSMLDDIESQLMEKGVIPDGEKKFIISAEDEEDCDCEDEDSEYDESDED